jgi:hypothetical protein
VNGANKAHFSTIAAHRPQVAAPRQTSRGDDGVEQTRRSRLSFFITRAASMNARIHHGVARFASHHARLEERRMERREFFKIAAGAAAGVVAFAATAQAAPLMPQPLNEEAKLPQNPAQPAVTSTEEADRLQPQEVRWGHGRHRGWGRGRHRGWHRRHGGPRRWHRRRW